MGSITTPFVRPPSLADCLPLGPPDPLLFEKKYHNLAVDMGALGRFFVDIHKYRNNQMNDSSDYETRTAEREGYFPLMKRIRQAADGDANLQTSPKDPVAIIRLTQDEQARKLYLTSGLEYVRKQRIYNAYTGKGGPEDIQLTLRLAIRFGLVAADTTSLKAYCDKYIGIDCSAFVCNYANWALMTTLDPSSKGAESFRYPEAGRRGTKLAIQPLDVLAWANTNHVAIISSLKLDYLAAAAARSSGTDIDRLECVVVESNMSQGLHNSTYRIVSVSPDKVFTVKRPDNSMHKVYIRPLI